MFTQSRSPRNRTPRVIAIGIVAATFGVGGAVGVTAVQGNVDSPDPAPARTSPALTDFAEANGLSGLSPASLQPVIADIADFARANGLTGLSPASLHEIPDQPQPGE
jgi:hypothetical protein